MQTIPVDKLTRAERDLLCYIGNATGTGGPLTQASLQFWYVDAAVEAIDKAVDADALTPREIEAVRVIRAKLVDPRSDKKLLRLAEGRRRAADYYRQIGR